MRIVCAALIFCFLIPAMIFAEEKTRTWTTVSGGKINAVWIPELDSEDGQTIRVEKDKKRYRINLDQLSEKDQNYIRIQRDKRGVGEYFPEEFEIEVLNEQSQSTVSQKYALLVGITDYIAMTDLQYTVNDVDKVGEQLIRLGFHQENIFKLTSGTRAELTPIKKNIEDSFAEILKKASENDMIFIMFAGHGIQDGNHYFCPMEGEISRAKETCISIQSIMDRLEKHDSKFKFLLVDACRNNMTRAAKTLANIDSPPKGIVLLQSCGSGEFSYEDPDLKHGIFSYTFVEALSGKADTNADGKLELFEVCTYSNTRTQQLASATFHAKQTPYVTGELANFILFEDLNRLKAQKLYESAKEFRDVQKYKDAKENITSALELYPDDPEYLSLNRSIDSVLTIIEKQETAEREKIAAENRAKEEEEKRRQIEQLHNMPGHSILNNPPMPNLPAPQIAPQIAPPTELASNFEYQVEDGQVTIKKYHGNSPNVTIPPQINGYPVRAIGSQAFSFCTKMISVSIPEGITTIGNQAFRGCISLTHVTLPSTVRVIIDNAFWGCETLTSVMIPEGVTMIGNGAFRFCENLASVTIPVSLNEIGGAAFDDTKINIAELLQNHPNFTNIDGVLFTRDQTKIVRYPKDKNKTNRYRKEKTNTIYAIPQGVTTIGESAFECCERLIVTIPAGVTKIENRAFRACAALTTINLPTGVTSIGDGAFQACRNLLSVTIPEGVTKIGSAAFLGCTRLTEIKIPEGVTKIEKHTFDECLNLSAIILPTSLTAIEGDSDIDMLGNNQKVTIYGKAESFAEEYAKNHRYQFQNH